MTDVQNCFASEQHLSSTVAATANNSSANHSLTTPIKNVQAALSCNVETSPFVLRAPTSANSKLILQNMAEVLDSVKKKHREKHKRKREQKRLAALFAERNQIQGITHTTDQLEKSQQKPAPQPLREQSAQHNGNASELSASSKPKLAKAEHSIMENNLKPPTNVFELMMNARNRSLGSNASGQEQLPLQAMECSTELSERKQLLQEWNDSKGGLKRKLADEARGKYIEQKLEQRSKRLKKMLTQPELMKQQVKSKKELLQAEKLSSSAPSTLAATPKAKRKRGRPRGPRRLSSLDGDNQLELLDDNGVSDMETAQFLSKLSSPTKKRDSLLGYFPKLQSSASPMEGSTETETLETPKRNTRRSKVNKPEPATAAVVTSADTPVGRPRRSCAGKARYDYDAEPSPTKMKKGPSEKEKAENSMETIDLDDSNLELIETPKRLAPLFMRSVPKPSPDPTLLRARNEFLHSGVPEKLRQEQQRQKQTLQEYEDNYELFPSIAHVTQLKAALKELPEVQLSLPLRVETGEAIESPPSKRKSKSTNRNSIGSITNCCAADFKGAKTAPSVDLKKLPMLENKRDIVKLWKQPFDPFPTFRCYNQMREKYRYFNAIDSAQDTQQMGESFVVTRRTHRSLEQQQQLDADLDAKPPDLAPNGELLYTEKYKPLMLNQVLVNLTPVQQLRDFLSNWHGGNCSKPNSQPMDDASFDIGNDSSSMGASSNTMVLLGPCSSGKTNAVFALANEMNFNVLEINAGMRRTGKKLIQELQEATQSHQLRKDKHATTGQPLLKTLSQNGLKSKRKENRNSNEELGQGVRKSLILIEDADVVFENIDAGFTEAIYTLAASSKRPVIVIASDPNCSHLQRFMQQNTIVFNAPNVSNICKFLAVLSLMENCPIELDDLILLYLYNKKNLRKTLLELQFYIQSGGDLETAGTKNALLKQTRLPNNEGTVYIHQRLFEFYTTPQNATHGLPFEDDFCLQRLNLKELLLDALPQLDNQTAVKSVGKRKSRSPKKSWLKSATQRTTEPTGLDKLCNFYENLSVAAFLDARLPLVERLQTNLTEEIAHTLIDKAISNNLGLDKYQHNLFDKPSGSSMLSEQMLGVKHQSLSARSLDYEPCLRAICRSEMQRAAQERRSSRFYHYLRNHTTWGASNFTSDVFDAACSIFQEPQTDAVEEPAECT